MLALFIAVFFVIIKSVLLITTHNTGLLNCSSEERSSWFYSYPQIPAIGFNDGLQTASFSKTRVQFPDASSWIQTRCHISLGDLQKNSDFPPQNHLYAKLFLQKINLEQVSASVGKSAEPGLSALLEQLAFQERCQ